MLRIFIIKAYELYWHLGFSFLAPHRAFRSYVWLSCLKWVITFVHECGRRRLGTLTQEEHLMAIDEGVPDDKHSIDIVWKLTLSYVSKLHAQ